MRDPFPLFFFFFFNLLHVYICADEGGRWQRLGRFAILYKESTTKRGGKIPLETSFWAWNVQRSKSVLHSGLGFTFILINEKKKEKNLGGKKKSKAREKLFGSGYEIEPPLEGEGNGNLVLKRESLHPAIVTRTWFAAKDR